MDGTEVGAAKGTESDTLETTEREDEIGTVKSGIGKIHSSDSETCGSKINELSQRASLQKKNFFGFLPAK